MTTRTTGDISGPHSLDTFGFELIIEARNLLRIGEQTKALFLLESALARPDLRQEQKMDLWRIERFRAAPPLIPADWRADR